MKLIRFVRNLSGILFCLALSEFARANNSLIDYMNLPPNPLNFEVTTKPNNYNSKQIIAEFGGTLNLKTSSGAEFILNIPPRALAENTIITIQEIVKLQNADVKFTETVHSVLITPSGIEFAYPVSLKITTPTKIPLRSIVPFGTDALGQGAYLVPVKAIQDNSVELMLTHFSTYSLTGSTTLREDFLKRVNLSIIDRLTSFLGNKRMLEVFGDETPIDMIPFVKEYVDKHLKPLMDGISSCKGGIEAIAEYLGIERQLALLSIDLSKVINSNAYPVAVSKTSHLCKEKAIDACYKDHRPFDVIDFWLGIARSNQLLSVYDDPIEAELKDIAIKCFSFEIDMKSNISVENPDGTKISHELSGKFFIKEMDGRGQIQIDQIDLKMPGMSCVQKSLRNSPEEDSIRIWLNDHRFDQSLGVSINPLMPEGNSEYACTDSQGKTTKVNTNYPWSILFRSLHTQSRNNEFNSKLNQWEFYKWNVYYAERFAEKQWINNTNGMSEKTNIIIFHRPVK